MAMLAGPARLTPNAIIASRMEARERLRRQEIEAGKPSQSSNGLRRRSARGVGG